MTNRLQPKLEWFLDGWHRQTGGDYRGTKLVVVDFHAKDRLDYKDRLHRIEAGGGEFVHVEPKPNVWQGSHRLTKENYFAASNARNTALCLAPDGHICYVDDLSVPKAGWWDAVKLASTRPDRVTCGAYAKVRDLSVTDDGEITFTPHPPGDDMRMRGLPSEPPPYPCMPGWHFGCSVCAPVEAYLKINGWPEACDGMGYEDCITGIAISMNGYGFLYDTRMFTYEDDGLHGVEKPFMRWDKGKSPNDKSHAMLNMFRMCARFQNYFPEPGIRALRNAVLGGAQFPIQQIPEHDWFDGQPLRDM